LGGGCRRPRGGLTNSGWRVWPPACLLADNGAGGDPDAPGHVDSVLRFGYTSTAGYEHSGHKKTNQDAFCVFEVCESLRRSLLLGPGPGPGPVSRRAELSCARPRLASARLDHTRRTSPKCRTSTCSACSTGMAEWATRSRTSSPHRCACLTRLLVRGEIYNGIDHQKNCLRFTYVFIVSRPHYLPPHPYYCSSPQPTPSSRC
jgi:hypothetical protein